MDLAGALAWIAVLIWALLYFRLEKEKDRWEGLARRAVDSTEKLSVIVSVLWKAAKENGDEDAFLDQVIQGAKRYAAGGVRTVSDLIELLDEEEDK